MQNISIPVERQNELFETEPATHLSLHDIFAAAAAGRSVSVSGNERTGARRISVPAKAALALSLLLHVALAIALCIRPIQAPIVMDEPLQAVWVTWSDTARPSDNKLLPHEAVLASAPAAVQNQPLSPATKAEIPPVVFATQEKPKALIPVVEQENITEATSGEAAVTQEIGGGREKTTGMKQAKASFIADTQTSASRITMARPRYRENAPPDYPREARRKGQEGVVVVHVQIHPDGRAGTVKIKTSSGHSLLDQAALEAVTGWKFEPARRMGKPAAAVVDIPIRFVLQSDR